MLANFDYFVSNVRTFWCTFAELNYAVVPQNGQISGRRLITFVAIAISKTSSSNSSCLAKTWSGVSFLRSDILCHSFHWSNFVQNIIIQTNTWKTWIIFETTSSEKLTVELSQGLITWKFTENLTMMKIVRMMPTIYQDLLKCYQMKKITFSNSSSSYTWEYIHQTEKPEIGNHIWVNFPRTHMCANIIQQF